MNPVGKRGATGLISIMATAFLTGCASTGLDNLGEYKKKSMPEAEQMPSKAELSGGKSKVVIFEVQDGNIAESKQAKVGVSITGELENYINDAGADLVDRSVAQKLKKEIRAAEMQGSTGYDGPPVGDFAVRGKVSQASFGSEFTEQRTYTNDDGETVTVPPKCTYTANVVANLDIYKLPSLDKAESFQMEGTVDTTEETRSSNCNASGQGLLREAAAEAVQVKRDTLQNFFAPKGYVVERRSLEDDNVFRVTLGEDLGAKEGKEVRIFKVVKDKNDLTGKTITEKRKVAEGLITNQVNKGTSWIRVSDPEKAKKVRMGHNVKVHYERGLIEKGMAIIN